MTSVAFISLPWKDPKQNGSTRQDEEKTDWNQEIHQRMDTL